MELRCDALRYAALCCGAAYCSRRYRQVNRGRLKNARIIGRHKPTEATAAVKHGRRGGEADINASNKNNKSTKGGWEGKKERERASRSEIVITFS